ncbi:MAG: hypothetical protein K2W82_17450 [Candidatus Obscuribacterales bacterium]|nr:hypothetical protein [Candidatus Obscuribacterales bacterium]
MTSQPRQSRAPELERLILHWFIGKLGPGDCQACLPEHESYLIEQAERNLRKMGLVDDNGLTEAAKPVLEILELGDFMSVRLALTIIAAEKHGCLKEAVICAAILGGSSNFLVRPAERAEQADAAHDALTKPEDKSDLDRVLRAYAMLVEAQRSKGSSEVESVCNVHFISVGAFIRANRLHGNLLAYVRRKGWKLNQTPATYEQLLSALVVGFSDRLMVQDGSIGWDCVDGNGIHLGDRSLFAHSYSRLLLPVEVIDAPRRRGGTIRLATLVAKVELSMDQLQALLGERLQLERHGFDFGDGLGDHYGTVYCTETWTIDRQAISVRRVPAPADHPATLTRLVEVILTGAQNKTQQSSSLALLAELQGLSQRASLPKPSNSSVRQWLQDHLGTTNSTAQAASSVPPMTWADLAALTNTPTLEADAAEVRQNFPDSITVNGVSLPVSYNGNGGIMIVIESSQVDQVLPHLQTSGFPAKFADRMVNVIVKLPNGGNAGCGIKDEDLCQLRREVARRLNVAASVSLPVEAGELVKSVQVQHPGKEQTIWLVAGAKVEFDDQATATSQARLIIERWLKDRAVGTARKYLEGVGTTERWTEDNERIQNAVAFGIAVLKDAVTDPQKVQEVLTTVERQVVAHLHGIFQPRIDERITLLAAAKPLGEQARQKQNEQARVAVRTALEKLRDDRDSSYAPSHADIEAARVQLDLARGLLPTLAGDEAERLQLGADMHALQQRIDRERKGEAKNKLKTPLLALKQRLATEDLETLRGEFNLLKARIEEALRQPAPPADGLRGGHAAPPKKRK